jgi:hypothetical protein
LSPQETSAKIGTLVHPRSAGRSMASRMEYRGPFCRWPLTFVQLLAWLTLVMQAAIVSVPAYSAGNDITTVAVLDFIPDKVTPATAISVSDSLSRFLSEIGGFRLWSRPKVREVTSTEVEGYPAEWTCRDIECAVAVGRDLRCNVVLIGSVSEFGRLITISVRAIDVGKLEVVGAWKSESLTGEAGIQPAVRELAERIADAKNKMPRGESAYEQEGSCVALTAPFEKSEASFAIGLGWGVYGHESDLAKVRWLAEIAFWLRRSESRLALGLRAGAASMSDIKTSLGDDAGFKFHICLQPGVIFHESRRLRLIGFGGIGHRDLGDASLSDDSYVTAGLSVRTFAARAWLTYWHGLGSGMPFEDMLTVNLSIGTGF